MGFTPLAFSESVCNATPFYEDYFTYEVNWANIVDVQFPVHIIAIMWYILLVVILITTTNSQLRSPYFQLYILNGIVDIINAFATEYIRVSQRVGLGPRMGWYLQISTAITGSNFAMHLLANCLMAFYQFSALWLPWFRNHMLQKTYMFGIMSVIVMGPLFAYSRLLFVPFHFAKEEEGLYFYTRRTQPIDGIRSLDAILTIACSILSIIFLGGTIYGIRVKTGEVIQQKIHQKSLIIVECINVMFGAMETIYSFIFLFDLPSDYFVLGFIYNHFLSYFFIMLILNSITLPISTRTIRREIKQRFFKPKPLQPRIEHISGLHVPIRSVRMPRK